MGENNLAIVKGLFAAFERGDAAGLVDPLSPDLVFHVREDEPEAGAHQGLEAATMLLANWLETFPGLTVEDPSFCEQGDWVVASFVLRGRGGASGVNVAEPYAWACHVLDGSVVEIREFRTEAQALASVA